MRVLTGIATNIREEEEVRGGGSSSVPTTTYVATFFVDRQLVEIRASKPLRVDQDDRVSIAGKQQGRFFKGLAYVNHTTGVRGNQGLLIASVFSILLPTMGVVSFLKFKPDESRTFAILVSAALVCGGIYFLLSALKINRAIKLLKRVDR